MISFGPLQDFCPFLNVKQLFLEYLEVFHWESALATEIRIGKKNMTTS